MHEQQTELVDLDKLVIYCNLISGILRWNNWGINTFFFKSSSKQWLLGMETKGSPLCGCCLFQSAAHIFAELEMSNHGIISGAQRDSLSTVYTCVALCASGERRKWLRSTESVLSKKDPGKNDPSHTFRIQNTFPWLLCLDVDFMILVKTEC